MENGYLMRRSVLLSNVRLATSLVRERLMLIYCRTRAALRGEGSALPCRAFVLTSTQLITCFELSYSGNKYVIYKHMLRVLLMILSEQPLHISGTTVTARRCRSTTHITVCFCE